MNIRRWIRRIGLAAGAVVAIVVLVLVATLTFDLGPELRERAERAGSKLIERPMHIGRLSIRLRSGNFVIEDLRIEGLTPADRPFLTAKRIEVSIYWWTFFRNREVLVNSIDMSDWDMQVEMRDGQSSFIKIPRGKPGATRSYTVTLARVDAVRGRFTYVDHGTWTTVSPNLSVHVDHDSGEYRGRASFSNGTFQIRNYRPMGSDMRCAFRLDGSKVHLDWIDLTTDGSHSVVNGEVDLAQGRWPEMLYRVRSDEVDFATMRQIFFAGEKFRVSGDGKFTGTFHLYKGGRDLQGSFSSPLLTLNGMRFPTLAGDLRWLPDRFTITNGEVRFHDGTAHFTYSMAPLGAPQPAVARFDTSYENVDLAGLTDSLKTQGLRLSGRAFGRNLLEWPLDRFSDHRGAGEISVRPPAGAQLYSRTSPPLPQQKPGTTPAPNVGVVPNLGYVPIAGTLRYQFGPEWVDVGASSVATPATYVEFSGRTAYGERSSFDFHARSGEWQESDKLLAAVITAFGSRTRTIPLGGYGEFTGRMVNSFRRPRIEGAFSGEQVRAFDVIWGRASGRVVVDNGYVDVTDGLVTKGGPAELRAEGRFSLSTPRDDGGEEINTHVTLKDWPIPDLRHAFDLDAYPIDGRAGGEYSVRGAYRRPFGSGTLTVTDGLAYGEPFERGTGTLKLEGVGVRIEGIDIVKGGGHINGGAYLSWDGKYSFNADGRGIPVERMAALKFANAPALSGVLSFRRASGAGAFASPSYGFEGVRIADLFIGDEGIGQVSGEVSVQDQTMAFSVDAASARLTVSGTGRISMAPGADADMSFRVYDTSLDPYLRALQPGAVSPFTSAIASGTVHVKGLLTDTAHLSAEASVEQLDMKLFDYAITNEKGRRLQLVFENNVVHLGDAGSAAPASGATRPARPPLVLVGQDTRLELSGDVNLGTEPYVQASGGLLPAQSMRVHADGDANLGILQGFFPDIRSSGSARLSADVQGPLRDVVFNGQARVANGRIRYYSLPHSIDAINGPITFTAGAIWLGDPKGDPRDPKNDLTAQVGGGPVTFSGRVDLDGFTPSRWAVTATGTNVHLRYPAGFNSVVDADLSLTGPYASPTLHGTVTVRSALYSKPIDITPALAFAAAGGGAAPNGAPAASSPAFPLRFNLQINAPSTLRLENNLARELVASANLTLQGSYDHPLLLGQAEIERGYIMFEGQRYTVTHGVLEFHNPTRIDPSFDFETETRVRVPGQSYFVDLRVVGTVRKLDIQLTSDPPLPQPEIASLLLGDIRNPEEVRNAELLALQRPNAATQDVLRARLEQLILSPGTAAVNKAFEQTLGVAVQVTPSLFDEFQHLSPSARVTIGKQISSRAYLTISRSLYAPQEDIIYLLEYDQSDRVSWVLSRNEDRTYAIDVRVRHTF